MYNYSMTVTVLYGCIKYEPYSWWQLYKKHEWEWISCMYLTGFEYIFVSNTCISNEDIFETG